MATEGDSYAKHNNILKNAPIVSGAIYLVKAGTWNGTSYPAGTTQSTAEWNYYFADVSTQIGKTMYYGFQDGAGLAGIAFLNVYGQIIWYKNGNGNVAALQEGVVEVPQGAHTLVLDYTTNISTNQEFYAYTIVENSKPESLILIKQQDLEDIADAIRYKLQQNEDEITYTPPTMAPAIDLIDTDVFLSSFIRETEPLYSGTIGTCRWEISRKGVLFIHGGELPNAEIGGLWLSENGVTTSWWDPANKKNNNYTFYRSFWYAYRNYIRMIIIDETVKTQNSIHGLFKGLNNLWLVLGFENIDTSDTTNFRSIFDECSNLTAVDLSNNNFQNMIYFDRAFCSCSQLREVRLPSNWQKVKYMQQTFDGCTLLIDLDITGLGSGSNLETWYISFRSCTNLMNFRHSIIDLKKMVIFSSTFQYCESLEELDTSQWETSSLLYYCNNTFEGCTKLKKLDFSKLNISGCAGGLTAFLNNCKALEEINTGRGWVFPKDASYSNWVQNCPAKIDTTYWDVSARTSLASFFANWKGSEPLNFTYWNTSNVTDMSYMFQNCSNLTGVNLFNFDMDKVTNMAGMFQGCSNLLWEELTFFDFFDTTSKVKNVSNMFNGCVRLKEFVLPFNTYSVTNFSGFLQGCYRLKKVDLDNLILNGSSTSGFPNASINADNMLTNCGNINTLIIPSGYDISYFQSGKSIKFPVNMYSAALEDVLDVEDIYLINTLIPDGGDTYYGCGSLTNGETFNKRIKCFINDIALDDKNTTYASVDSQVRKIVFYATDADMGEDLFDLDFYVAIGDYYNYAGAYAAFDLESGELSVFTPNRLIFFAPNSSRLFANFTGLLSIEFNDVTTVRVENMSYLFQNCKTMPEIDLSTFNTKHVSNMSYMFSGCTYLEEVDFTPLSLFSCTNIRNITEKCTMLQKITFFNQAPMQAFIGQEMFMGCTNLIEFIQPETLSSFIFTNLQGAFLNCSSLEEILLPQWAVGALTSCSQMFMHCTSLKRVDISSWRLNPAIISSMSYMFANCPQLLRIDFPEQMEPLLLTSMAQMFYNCRRLGMNQVGPNGEEGYFKIIPIKLICSVEAQQNGTYKATMTPDATYALVGCECIKTLDLSGLEIEINQGFTPNLTNFMSAGKGANAGYLLDKIIMGDKIEMYFYANTSFTVNKRASAASPDVRYESQTTGEITYDIPTNTADTYRVIYPN